MIVNSFRAIFYSVVENFAIDKCCPRLVRMMKHDDLINFYFKYLLDFHTHVPERSFNTSCAPLAPTFLLFSLWSCIVRLWPHPDTGHLFHAWAVSLLSIQIWLALWLFRVPWRPDWHLVVFWAQALGHGAATLFYGYWRLGAATYPCQLIAAVAWVLIVG